MQPSTESVQRLMEIGFVAVGNGLLTDAEAIFAGVQAVRPDSELPLIGRAFVRMNARQYREAVRLLQQAMEKNPESDLAMGFLGAALKLSGMNQTSREVLQQVIDANGSEEAVALAKSLLEKQPTTGY